MPRAARRRARQAGPAVGGPSVVGGREESSDEILHHLKAVFDRLVEVPCARYHTYSSARSPASRATSTLRPSVR